MRKRILAALAAMSPLALFAEGGNNSFSIDTTQAEAAVTEIQSKLSTFMTGPLLTAILGLMGAGLVIWLVFFAIRRIRKGGEKAGA